MVSNFLWGQAGYWKSQRYSTVQQPLNTFWLATPGASPNLFNALNREWDSTSLNKQAVQTCSTHWTENETASKFWANQNVITTFPAGGEHLLESDLWTWSQSLLYFDILIFNHNLVIILYGFWIWSSRLPWNISGRILIFFVLMEAVVWTHQLNCHSAKEFLFSVFVCSFEFVSWTLVAL